MHKQVASKIPAVFLLVPILVLTFLSYLPILKGEFLLWDDDVHVLENITIRGLDLEHVLEMFTSTVNKIYIPLTSLSFALEHHFFGYNPFAYHLDNVLLHLLVVVMVFLLGRELGLSQAAAGVAALIFGIHPVHVESVAWITERKDVLYAAFYMAALLSYLRYLGEKRFHWLWVTTILGALSMLSKPMALSLPLILVLLDWFKGRPFNRQAFIEKLPLGVIIGGIAWITYAAHARIPGESVVQSALIWPWTFTFYLRQFFFPYISVPLHRLAKPVLLTNPEYFLSLAVLVLVVLALARLQSRLYVGTVQDSARGAPRRNKWFVFAVLFYFLSIFFLLRFDETKDVNTVADRFMYLPSLGFCFLAGLWLNPRQHPALPRVLGVILLGTIFSFKTFQQSHVWRDSMSLWRHDLKYYPDEPLALNNFAIVLGKTRESGAAQKEYKKVMRSGLAGVQKGLAPEVVAKIRKVDHLIGLYQRAVEAEPGYMDAHYNLGDLYARIGRFPEAVEAYKKALEIDPKFKDAHCGLGDVYVEAGDARQAVFAFDQALQLNPEDKDLHVMVVKAYTKAIEKNPGVSAYQEARSNVLARYAAMVNKDRPKAASYFNLGNLYIDVGDAGMALLAYRRALEIDPRNSGALYNLGNLYKEQGRFKEALGFYQKALDVDPRMADAWLNMGVIYGRQGEKDREKSFYQKALRVDPRNGRAYFNLAFLEEAAENLPGALELYRKSVTLDPANAEGYYNMGNIYARLNNTGEAISSYLKAVDQDSLHMNALVNLSILSFQKEDFAAAVKYCDEAVLLGYDAPEGYLNALAPYRVK
ncbi:MAG: tetratricopeptide repeat protein [Candidatus Omnitrophica bacterium]|nr:tetratricopeptide repeat protein [Candidatus Omnitrophota bacterium]